MTFSFEIKIDTGKNEEDEKKEVLLVCCLQFSCAVFIAVN